MEFLSSQRNQHHNETARSPDRCLRSASVARRILREVRAPRTAHRAVTPRYAVSDAIVLGFVCIVTGIDGTCLCSTAKKNEMRPSSQRRNRSGTHPGACVSRPPTNGGGPLLRPPASSTAPGSDSRPHPAARPPADRHARDPRLPLFRTPWRHTPPQPRKE